VVPAGTRRDEFELDLEAQFLGERRGVAIGRPSLEFGILVGLEADRDDLALGPDVHVADDLGVAAVEPLGQAHEGAEESNRGALGLVEILVAFVTLLWRGLAVIARDERDDADLLRVEAAEAAVLDQIVRMPMMPLIADVQADVVEQRAVLEPVTLALAESVPGTRGIEER